MSFFCTDDTVTTLASVIDSIAKVRVAKVVVVVVVVSGFKVTTGLVVLISEYSQFLPEVPSLQEHL